MTDSAVAAGMTIKQSVLPRRSARSDKPQVKHPKWHDKSCHDVYKSIKNTSFLLSKEPNNAWLRGRLITETKQYNKLLKSKQKQFIDATFSELENLSSTDPKAYMDLVKALREGSHDLRASSDTDSVSPNEWVEHFTDLLGKSKAKSEKEADMEAFIMNNQDKLSLDLEQPFTKKELIKAISNLKNNKASSFDKVRNEMLKASHSLLFQQILLLFNTILRTSIYPLVWKYDILGPLHKSGPKDDPGNFRGISVSSCLGKLFNSLLRNRLEDKCVKESIIHKCQASGKEGARTSDHLLVFKHLIDKYVKHEKRKLFVAFFDLKKAFDTVPRVQLFHTLLVRYKIGGRFLKILQAMYDGNHFSIKLNQGLTQPIFTTAGVKQGCVLSPIVFNLYINDLPDCYNSNCNPVSLNGSVLNCLMWADDCIVFSLSKEGLQESINCTSRYFQQLGLSVNIKKTKVMIFNPRGLGSKNFPDFKFLINGNLLENTDSYSYLGLIFKPSGTVTAATAELYTKASRAWFSISHIIYQNKRLSVQRGFKLLDSLVMPCGLYASEFTTPFVIPQKSLDLKRSLISVWETFQLEKINQRAGRMLLSVHSKASRLAVLGETGRYPVYLQALRNTLKYEWSLTHKSGMDSLAKSALTEMQEMCTEGKDCWLSRVRKIREGLELSMPPSFTHPTSVGRKFKFSLQKLFDVHFLESINDPKIGPDSLSHNKLRFYCTLKKQFSPEPYICKVNNRNQRTWLSRLRCSAHHLGIETGRWKKIPEHERICEYCSENECDDYGHFLLRCPLVEVKRNCFEKKLSCLIKNYESLDQNEKLIALLCPINPQVAKLVNKFAGIMFNVRRNLDMGVNMVEYATLPSNFEWSNLVDSDVESVADLSFQSTSSSEHTID